MRPSRLILFLFVLAILVQGTPAADVHAQDTPALLRLDDISLPVGDTGIVNARLNCGQRVCSAFALTLRYNPEVIDIIGVEIGGMLGNMAQGQVILPENAIDPARGEVRLAASAIGTSSPLNDVMFRLTIRAVVPGETLLFVSRLELVDSSIPPNPINAVQAGGLATVINPLPAATSTRIPTITLAPTLTPFPTLTPTLTDTPRPPVRLNTFTPVPSNTLRATSAPSATRIGIPASLSLNGLPLTSLGAPDFGPVDHTLVSQANNQVEIFSANVEYTNFVAQVEVVFPSPMPDGWNFGILFRSSSGNSNYRLVFSQDGINMSWLLRNRIEEESNIITRGTVFRPIQRSVTVTLFALDDLGIVFWNGAFMTTLDLSDRRNAGDVRIGTDIYSDTDGLLGSTTFLDFVVWELESVFGPESGTLEHADDQTIKMSTAGVFLDDFIVQTTFSVPYASANWDVGYLFRDLPGNDEFRIIIEGDGDWLFYLPTFLNDIERQGELSNLRTGVGQSNTLILIALDDLGIVLLNGAFVTELDLSVRTTAGSISAATGIVAGQEIEGAATNYSNYRIWVAS